METITKVYPNGVRHDFKLTREKGFFTSHIWVYKDGKPYLHILRTDANTCKVFKNCEKYGYLPCGELMNSFDEININMVIGL